MILNLAGIPVGYGYFQETAVPNENIAPKIKEWVLQYDPNALPMYVQTMSIQVKGDTMVSINKRAPVLVTPDCGFSFDVRGSVFSIVFDSEVSFNIAFTY